MMLIRNQDQDSARIRGARQHASAGARRRHVQGQVRRVQRLRGGGRFSGRITATFVMGGAVAKKLLRETLGIEIIAYTSELGGLRAEGFTLDDARKNRYSNEVRSPDPKMAEEMKKQIIEVRGKGDSLGGVVECVALNVPQGLGEPVFGSLDSDLAEDGAVHPGGQGRGVRVRVLVDEDHRHPEQRPVHDERREALLGDQQLGRDSWRISSGMPVVYRIAFKPAASVAAKQRTFDTAKNEEVEVVVPGRHDPTVVPRAVPVVESVTALVLADHAIRGGFIAPVLERVDCDELREGTRRAEGTGSRQDQGDNRPDSLPGTHWRRRLAPSSPENHCPSRTGGSRTRSSGW